VARLAGAAQDLRLCGHRCGVAVQESHTLFDDTGPPLKIAHFPHSPWLMRVKKVQPPHCFFGSAELDWKLRLRRRLALGNFAKSKQD
jgi:hypothetical protein